MPRQLFELSGSELFMLAEQSHAGACREMMRREIMAADNMEYEDTTPRLLEMSELIASTQNKFIWPLKGLIYFAGVSGFVSIPLVFSQTTATAFNDYFVTADPPDVGDADTVLEIGAWSWNWMEPPLGTISFFLLCMQYVREKRVEVGWKGAGVDYVRSWQAQKLVEAYGDRYDHDILRAYGAGIALLSDAEEIYTEQLVIDRVIELKKLK